MENSVLIQNVKPEEFYERIRITVREEIDRRFSKPEKNKKFLTRKETANRLRISLPTLNTYTNKGVLIGVRFGYRVLYREEDVESAIKEIPNRR
jgi:excisionase family DNA binding protein